MGDNLVKIESVHIKNLRSFAQETVYLNDYTCLVGPNGSGKSTILCALNIFFRDHDAANADFAESDEQIKTLDSQISSIALDTSTLKRSLEIDSLAKQRALIEASARDLPKREAERDQHYATVAGLLAKAELSGGPGMPSASDQSAQVGVDLLGIRGGHAMREAWVEFRRAVFQQLRRQRRRICEGHDLVVFAMHRERGHFDRFQVFCKIRLGERDDAVVMRLGGTHHAKLSQLTKNFRNCYSPH